MTIAGHVMGNVNVKYEKEELKEQEEIVRDSPVREKTDGKGIPRKRRTKKEKESK